MQGIKPATCLVNAFGNKIGRESFGLNFFLVLKRKMPLGIRHGAAVEPDVDQVGLAVHGLSADETRTTSST
jgi:hypothetical protein